MFKRVRWVSLGALLGAGGSLYAQIRLRRTARRYLPAEVTSRVVDQAQGLRADLRDALDEGRRAMAEREAELRARLDPAGPAPATQIRNASTRELPPAPPRRSLPEGRKRRR